MAPRQTPRQRPDPMTALDRNRFDDLVSWMDACIASAGDVICIENMNGSKDIPLHLSEDECIHRAVWQTRVRLVHLTRPIAPSHSLMEQLVTEAGWVFRQAPDSDLVGLFTFAIALETLSHPSEAKLSLERATGTNFEVEVIEDRLAEAGDGEGPCIPRPVTAASNTTNACRRGACPARRLYQDATAERPTAERRS